MEYIAEQHRELIEAHRAAEVEAERTVWPDRPDAINRVVVFDTRALQD
ncbi:hypothetical protein [Streptacidiphilus anmyonensis]|nr:hypothetical protein [Streptacidiphilus anmyonensis]